MSPLKPELIGLRIWHEPSSMPPMPRSTSSPLTALEEEQG